MIWRTHCAWMFRVAGLTLMDVAWMDSTKSNIGDVCFIENWPSAGNRTASKVPTVISYQETRVDDDHIEHQPEDVGFEVSPCAQHTAACFKLLDEKAKLTGFDDPTVLGLGDCVAPLGKGPKILPSFTSLR